MLPRIHHHQSELVVTLSHYFTNGKVSVARSNVLPTSCAPSPCFNKLTSSTTCRPYDRIMPSWPCSNFLSGNIFHRCYYLTTRDPHLHLGLRQHPHTLLIRCRHISVLTTLHPTLLAPLVFTGLLVTLWTYKSLVMVLFQSRILYMPSIPFGSRRERVEDYEKLCKGIKWETRFYKTSHGQRLAMVVGRIGGKKTEVVTTRLAENDVTAETKRERIILYFQGNASSTPPRLPSLSSVLSSLRSSAPITLIALSSRGYWYSSGFRPNQRGILSDNHSILTHLCALHPHAEFILWGQSLGCNIALLSAAHTPAMGGRTQACVLETPFVGVAAMLRVMYPQRWLPYRYLGPFLWNRWDVTGVLSGSEKGLQVVGKRVLVVKAGSDEVVPEAQTEEVVRLLQKGADAVRVEVVEVRGALHTEAVVKRQGQDAVVRFLDSLDDK